MPAKWQLWFPFRIDAFRGSPSVQAMHPSARAGYLYLLSSCWQSDDCSISSDPLVLAEESGLGDELWSTYGARILRKFEILPDNKLINLSLQRDWIEAKRVFEARNAAAQRTNTERWASGKQSVTDTVTDRRPNRSAYTRTGTGTYTETNTKTRTEKQKQGRASAPELSLPDWVPVEPWNAFLEMRKDIKAPLSVKAAGLAIKELEKLNAEGENLAEVLNQSTMKSWRGLFPVHRNGGRPNGKHESLQDVFREFGAEEAANQSSSGNAAGSAGKAG